MATMKKYGCPPGQHMVNNICTPKIFSGIGPKIGLGTVGAGAVGMGVTAIKNAIAKRKAKKEEEKKKEEEAAKETPTQRRGGAMKYKTGGMVNANAKVSALKSAGSKGVRSGVNAKAKASTVAKGRSGGTSKAPKKATPTKNKRG